MKIQEVKTYINRILGDNVRCLLPSYWWKRAFGVVLDAMEHIVPIVGSKKELDKLDSPKGTIAAVKGEGKSFSECYLIHDSSDFTEDMIYNNIFSVIKKVNVKAADIKKNLTVALFCINPFSEILFLSDVENNRFIGLAMDADDNGDEFILIENGAINTAGVDKLNRLLAQRNYFFVGGDFNGDGDDVINTPAVINYLDTLMTWDGPADAYIKSQNWEQLAKQSDIPNMSILNNKQDKLVSGENIKTINGSSILGAGDISWSVPVDDSMSDTSTNAVQNKVIKAYVDSKANMPVRSIYDTASAVISPNVYTVFGTLQTTTISLETADSSIVNDYVIEFKTAPSGEISIDFPSDIKWANGIKPQFENDATYQISIIRNLAVVTMFI